MSKLLKSELKEIVKECLVEILSEGISPSAQSNSVISESRTQRRQRRSAFDHVSWARENKPQEEKSINAKQAASSLTSDPILAEVLADSKKTMINQIEAERRGPSASSGDFAQRKASESDPLSLFGGSAGNWAALAFDDK